MSVGNSWQAVFEHELAQAEAARMAGNEGRARVCARRAAGAVIGEYLRRHHLPVVGSSVVDRLEFLQNRPGLDSEVRAVLDHLLTRVTVEHDLPVEADLLEDTRRLRRLLLES